MWPDRVSNPGPLALESGALPTASRIGTYGSWSGNMDLSGTVQITWADFTSYPDRDYFD